MHEHITWDIFNVCPLVASQRLVSTIMLFHLHSRHNPVYSSPTWYHVDFFLLKHLGAASLSQSGSTTQTSLKQASQSGLTTHTSPKQASQSGMMTQTSLKQASQSRTMTRTSLKQANHRHNRTKYFGLIQLLLYKIQYRLKYFEKHYVSIRPQTFTSQTLKKFLYNNQQSVFTSQICTPFLSSRLQ